MSQYKVLKRYSLIIEKVQQHYYPNLIEIIDFLARKGYEISERTIQRDLEQLGIEFGLYISYSRAKRGYYIAEKNKIQLEPFLNLLEIIGTAEIISTSLSESRETLQYIAFDSGERIKGVEFLKPALQALREHRKLSMEYQSFKGSEKKKIELYPYLLKEYMGRWYLVACYTSNSKKLYLFGLDRILSLEVTTQSFEPDEKIDPKQRFKQIIGISDNNEATQKVLLSFKPDVVPYLKSLPLHNTQRITCETDKECKIEISVKINNELISKILSFGPSAKVLSPTSLARKVKRLLSESVSAYF